MIFVKAISIILWIMLLVILKRAGLRGWYMMSGVLGLFIISFLILIPVAVGPLSAFVAATAGFFGRITDTFEAYFKYGIIFIKSNEGYITLKIDFECSGLIEILLYMSWVLFFSIFNRYQKVIMSLIGLVYILFINSVRIIIICEFIHFGGNSWYNFAHNVAGKLFFYVFIVMFYFYVFTKQQIISMKLGGFNYDAVIKNGKKK